MSTDVYEVIGSTVTRYATLAEAQAARGNGVVRHRAEFRTVPAVFQVVDGEGHETARFEYPVPAAEYVRTHGGRALLVPEDWPVT